MDFWFLKLHETPNSWTVGRSNWKYGKNIRYIYCLVEELIAFSLIMKTYNFIKQKSQAGCNYLVYTHKLKQDLVCLISLGMQYNYESNACLPSFSQLSINKVGTYMQENNFFFQFSAILYIYTLHLQRHIQRTS